MIIIIIIINIIIIIIIIIFIISLATLLKSLRKTFIIFDIINEDNLKYLFARDLMLFPFPQSNHYHIPFISQMGHQDFYPNGGRTQPGCSGSDLLSGCSHMRAVALFSESARSTACSFAAYPCDSWRTFTAGECRDCGESGCAVMGYHANQNTAVTGKFYLQTNPRSPYCFQD